MQKGGIGELESEIRKKSGKNVAYINIKKYGE